MNLLTREKEAKLALLESMTKSQIALSRMLTTIADGYELINSTQGVLAEHILLIDQCRQEMADMIGIIKLNPLNKGTPAPPWYVNQQLSCRVVSQD